MTSGWSRIRFYGYVKTDDRGLIEGDLSCSACGYNLRAMPTESDCPECGQAISITVREARRSGWLAHVGPGLWLAATAGLWFLGVMAASVGVQVGHEFEAVAAVCFLAGAFTLGFSALSFWARSESKWWVVIILVMVVSMYGFAVLLHGLT